MTPSFNKDPAQCKCPEAHKHGHIQTECCEKCDYRQWVEGYMDISCRNEKCPCHSQPDHTEEWRESLTKIWYRAHVPDFAQDTKIAIEKLIEQVITHQRQQAQAELREELLGELKEAWINKGINPGYHVQQMRNLESAWPSLYRAIQHLIKSSNVEK